MDRFLEGIDLHDDEFFAEAVCQVKWGCRHEALVYKGLTPSQISDLPEVKGIVGIANIYEAKTDKHWQKWLDKPTMAVLRAYIQKRNIKQDQPLFAHSLSWYNDKMKLYGMKAGLCRYESVTYRTKKGKANRKWKFISGIPMSSHLLRHTFAFACSNNDVRLEETADLGGWEDVNTLKDFYYYVPPEKLRDAYGSIDWKKETPKDKMKVLESRKQPLTDEELEEIEKEEP